MLYDVCCVMLMVIGMVMHDGHDDGDDDADGDYADDADYDVSV